MTISAPKKQNALVFYVRTLLYMLVALVLRVIAFAPLACLVLFDKGQWQQWLWLLCPVMVVFGVLPLRYSFAQAMTAQPRRFSFDAAFSFSHYGEKLKESLLHALHVIKWGIPLAVLLALGYYWYSEVDYLELYQAVDELGNTCAQLIVGAANWLAGLAGAEFFAVTANNFMLGVGAVLAVLGLGVLIWIWGAVRNSAGRYIWAVAARTDRVPRAEMRRRLQGRRLRQLGVALVNLILWIPFLYVAANAARTAVSDLSTLLMMAIAAGELPTAELASIAAPVAGAFAALYLPLLPLRRWNTAAFAARNRRIKADKKVSA